MPWISTNEGFPIREGTYKTINKLEFHNEIYEAVTGFYNNKFMHRVFAWFCPMEELSSNVKLKNKE